MANGNIVFARLSTSLPVRTLDGKLQILIHFSLTRAVNNGGPWAQEMDSDTLVTVDPAQTDTELLNDMRTQVAAFCTARYLEDFPVTDIRGCYP